ncbi:MAG TPA: M20/M25/M40 family metallo-hydrolase [Gemmatimonadales bacterium]
MVRRSAALAFGLTFTALGACSPPVETTSAPTPAPAAAQPARPAAQQGPRGPSAQGATDDVPRQGRPVEPRPDYVRAGAPTDPVIQRMWQEGMQRSQAPQLMQVLLDSIGPRLNASPRHRAGNEWLIRKYGEWGIQARDEQYGTWNAWDRGITHIDLVSPRVRSLEGMMLAWSPGTGGKPVEADVVVLPEAASPEAMRARFGDLRGKWVMISAPQLSCRSRDQLREFGRPETLASLDSAQRALTASFNDRRVKAVNINEAMKEAGVAGVLTMQWSGYPGINKVFGSWRQEVPTLELSCEDYGMLYRLAVNDQGPKIRVTAESKFLGEQPVFNTIAEIRGTEKPEEYVMLSAHFDSWDGAQGATDNGTGTITMLEAARILKAVYPNPKRTILIGHWGGEEQGLNGSHAFVEDNPKILAGLHALFNQDNGTGRVVNMSASGLAKAGPVLTGYLSQLPSQITQYIDFADPGMPSGGGTDHASFICAGAPGFNLGALSWDYGGTTWHTNRDTYDKVVMDDLKNNATLAAMLAYLASEDPSFMPRDRAAITGRDGQPAQWPGCSKAARKTADSPR